MAMTSNLIVALETHAITLIVVYSLIWTYQIKHGLIIYELLHT